MSTNKKNFITSFVMNGVILILLIEHLCGLELALESMHLWICVSILVHAHILRDYIHITYSKKK